MDKPLKMVYSTINSRSIFLGAIFFVVLINNGAPMTTPKAYAEMRWPPCGIDIDSEWLISVNSPIIPNSVVPMAKPPRANGSNLLSILN